MKITILSDRSSWLNEYLKAWIIVLKEGHDVNFVHEPTACKGGDLLFLLSCSRIIGAGLRSLYRNCLVIHESDLPKGRGWSPLTWQILEGKNRIPITLFEAAEDVDSGVIYAKDVMVFEGHELVSELRYCQAEKTIQLCQCFIDNYPAVLKEAQKQSGESTFYLRRRPDDSRLNPDRSLAEQFDLLRVVDNVRYPAFFEYRGHRYYLQITKAGSE